MKVRLLLLLLAGLPASLHAAVPPAEVRSVDLANGITVLLVPDSLAAGVDVGVWVRSGSRDEGAGAAGLAHLVERTMFMGTPRQPGDAFARAVLAQGGAFVAETTPDWTVFSTTVPPEGLANVLALEADRFGSPQITPGALEAARRAVRDEQRGGASRTPAGVALRLLYTGAFAGHGYARPVVGLEPDLGRITLKQAQAYRTSRYVPGRMVVTLAGRFDADEALAALKRTLGALPGTPAAAPQPQSPPVQTAERRAHGQGEGASPVVGVGWRTGPLTDPDRVALEGFARVLFQGTSSRLQRDLVRSEHPVCSGLQGGLDLRAAGGLLYVLAGPAPGSDTARVEQEVIGAAERLAREGPTPEELEGARRGLELDALSALETPAGLGREISEAFLSGAGAGAVAARLERVRALTAADLQRAGARVVAATGRTVAIVTATAPGEDRP